MRWKREGTGKYVCGAWLIEGQGTHWTLFYGTEKIGAAGSKKELQAVAEDAENHPEKLPKKTPKRPPGKKINKDPQPEDLPAVVEQSQGPVSLDTALRSIRLSLDGLAHSNNALAADMRRLADSNEEMAKGLRELMKYLGSVEKKK